MSKKLKEITRILKEHDVRDPRGALVAIEAVLGQKDADPRKALATIKLFDDGGDTGHVEIKNSENFQAKHLVALIRSLGVFGEEKFPEGPGCEGCEQCQPESARVDELASLIKRFADDLRAKSQAEAANKKEGE